MRSAAVGFQCPSCVKDGHASARVPKAAYGGKAHAEPRITQLLIGLNVVMFLLTTATGTGLAFGGSPSRLFQQLALVPTTELAGQHVLTGDGVAQGAYYRLLTSTFLHFGIVHIAVNMYCLLLIGPALESALGRLRFTALYVLSGLSGAALSYSLGPTLQIAAGASGAVFGLFAAYFVLEHRRGGDVSAISATILINLFISFVASSYIDWRGHVGGLVGGALVAAAFVYAPAGRQRWVYQALGAVVVAVLIVAVVAARTAQLTTA
ncbi:MAG: rhomboid family intramembrane serine protease [Mycobacteriales bacterium]